MKNKKNYLDFIPEKNEKNPYSADENGVITISRINGGWMERLTQRFLKKPPVTTITLEEYGNFIWPLIDGKRSVYEIGQLVKEQFGEACEPLYPRLSGYFVNMEQNHLIHMK